VTDEIDSARLAAAALRPQGDIIVLLSHAGEEMDQRLAEQVPDIDVIVGSHSHSRLLSGELVWHSEDLQARAVNGTVVVHAPQWGGELGRLDLLFDKDEKGVWHVERYRARLIPVTVDIPEDAGVAAVVSEFWKPIAPRYAEVIGQAAGEFSSRGDDLAQYNLMADALRESLNVDIAMENMGGIRAPLLRGAVTRGDLVMLDRRQSHVQWRHELVLRRVRVEGSERSGHRQAAHRHVDRLHQAKGHDSARLRRPPCRDRSVIGAVLALRPESAHSET
jgi:5'-nucleotidase